jgi:hypothetical protein
MTRNDNGQFDALNASQLKSLIANARPALAPCLCGCGNTTKGRFFPGHDATLKAALHQTEKTGSPAAKKSAKVALAAFGW